MIPGHLNHRAGGPALRTATVLLLVLIVTLCGPAGAGAAALEGDYVSPYSVHFKNPESSRTQGWNMEPWSNPKLWSPIPWSSWNDPAAYSSKSFANLAYGARAIRFPAPAGFDLMPPGLRRERVITAALHLAGLHYQHHHIPVFDPYPARPDWPWIAVRSGLRGPGLDCSNFTAWVYNFALGVHITSDVVRGAGQSFSTGPAGERTGITAFGRTPGQSFDNFVASLKPADLLFIQGEGKHAGRVSHVVLWLGTMAADRNGKDRYFIIDSTGEGRLDSAGNRIPDGVQIRAFREESWYFRNVAVVHRVIGD